MADLVISNSTLNGTLDEQIRDLHVDMAVTVLLCVELSWIVVSNGMIMLCFVINRRKSWPVFARYLLALSICDFMNGFTCIAFLVVSFLPEHYEVIYICVQPCFTSSSRVNARACSTCLGSACSVL